MSELRFHTFNPSTIGALMSKKFPYTMPVSEFKRRIADYLKYLPDDAQVYFGQGDLSFYRMKNRGYYPDTDTPRLVQIEFNQVYDVDIDPEQND